MSQLVTEFFRAYLGIAANDQGEVNTDDRPACRHLNRGVVSG